MNLIKQKVTHRVYGIGTITEQDDKSVTVKFKTKICRFIYPDAFTAYITAVDESIQAAVIKGITDVQAVKVEEKRAEEVARKHAADALEAAQKAPKKSAKAPAKPKAPTKPKTPAEPETPAE